MTDAPVCPTCGQPATTALAGPEPSTWECRNEACAEFGQPLQVDEPMPSEPPDPDGFADRRP